MSTIAVLGTLDTKGAEHAFVAQEIRRLGYRTLLIDAGSAGPPTVPPAITREQLRQYTVGNSSTAIDLPSLPNDRGQAIEIMSRAAATYVRDLASRGEIDGVISLGGTGGTSIGCAAMRALPLGFPKVMVSTVAGGNVSAYVDVSDIVMIPSIVDVSGLNRISQGVFARAAAVVTSMAAANQNTSITNIFKPVIVASMFGNTTKCVEHARRLLENAGYEVIVFHATGAGGRTMESLIESGMVSGVLDVTTTEWADELVGGTMGGGPNRLDAAARHGVPAVIAPGCLDMVNFRERSSVPVKFQNRTFYQHNPQVTLMRTTPQECRQLGEIIARKINRSTGPVHVLFPLRAISVISAIGGPFHDPVADEQLRSSLHSTLLPHIPYEELDCEINDPTFAKRCVELLLNSMTLRQESKS